MWSDLELFVSLHPHHSLDFSVARCHFPFRISSFVAFVAIYLQSDSNHLFVSVCSIYRWNNTIVYLLTVNTLNTNHWHSLQIALVLSNSKNHFRFSVFYFDKYCWWKRRCDNSSGIIRTIVIFHCHCSQHFHYRSITGSFALFMDTLSLLHWDWESVKFIWPDLPHIKFCLQYFAAHKYHVA